jgi:hypothetical protein
LVVWGKQWKKRAQLGFPGLRPFFFHRSSDSLNDSVRAAIHAGRADNFHEIGRVK